MRSLKSDASDLVFLFRSSKRKSRERAVLNRSRICCVTVDFYNSFFDGNTFCFSVIVESAII